MRLSELVRVRAITGGVDRICQVNTAHVSKSAIRVTVKQPQVTQEDFGAVITDIKELDALQIEVCPVCIVEFMGDISKEIAVLNAS